MPRTMLCLNYLFFKSYSFFKIAFFQQIAMIYFTKVGDNRVKIAYRLT